MKVVSKMSRLLALRPHFTLETRGPVQTHFILENSNNLLMSIHVLKYINDLNYRRNIQKCLNRGELSNKLIKAIRCYHKGKLNAKTDLEQAINNECTRLIANIVLYFNTFLMSELVKLKESLELHDDAEKIKRYTPTSWVHILFQGYFHIRSRKNMDLDKILADISRMITAKTKSEVISNEN